jgi:hypothetical protein
VQLSFQVPALRLWDGSSPPSAQGSDIYGT